MSSHTRLSQFLLQVESLGFKDTLASLILSSPRILPESNPYERVWTPLVLGVFLRDSICGQRMGSVRGFKVVTVTG